MKYLKTYESWLTNIFKSTDSDSQNYQDTLMTMYDSTFSPLMGAAAKGNWKRFKFLLPEYKIQINNILHIPLDSGVVAKENVLSLVVTGKR